MAGVSKTFGGIRALDAVDFEVSEGEIHALLGENGAGKSTLIKVLGGAVVPDAGRISLDGKVLPPGDPRAARRRGIAVIHQELMLVPGMTAAENIFLGRERGGLVLDRAGMRRSAQELLDSLGGSGLDASTRVDTLSIAQRQLVEIARALAQGDEARILVLDEPSAVLTKPETERLFGVLKGLRARGMGIVYISHRLEEVFSICDRLTVLRDGRRVATAPVAGLDRAELIRWMVGRDLSEEFPSRTAEPGDAVLEARGLSSPGRFSDVSFTVRRGEILGLSGLVGAGRTSVALALFGAIPSTGEILLEGRPMHMRHPRQAIDAGLAYVTEDRKARGLFPLLDAGANLTMAHLESYARLGLISPAKERSAAESAARDLDLRAAGLGQRASTLSGGNQQKLLLGRFLLKPLKLLILDEPTRGIDVGAKAEIYRLMHRLTARGLAILMISSELPEILGMADRVVVMHEGRSAGELSRTEASPGRVMELATGGA